jgi:fructokinase
MTASLIGAVAIEDESISFVIGSYEHDTHRLYPIFNGPNQSIPKPESGYSRLFIKGEIKRFFDSSPENIEAVGISMFGMIDTVSHTLVDIPGRDWDEQEFELWRKHNLNLCFKEIFTGERWENTRISVLNDATTAALGEYSEYKERIGKEGRNDRGDVFAYVRVGSGINAGILRNGFPIRYRLHPEIGHVRPMRHHEDVYQGCCSFHRNCFEGLASLRAIKEREEYSLSTIGERSEDKIADIQSYYLAQICVILNMTVAPNRIVLAGAAIQDRLLDPIREYFEQLVGDFPRYKENMELDEFIQPAQLNNHISLRGTLELAKLIAEDKDGFFF